MRRAGVSLPAGKWFIWTLVLIALAFLVVYGAPVLERLFRVTREIGGLPSGAR